MRTAIGRKLRQLWEFLGEALWLVATIIWGVLWMLCVGMWEEDE